MKKFTALVASATALAALGGQFTTSAQAQTGSSSVANREARFSIAEKDLATALSDFSRVTGLQVVADPQMLQGKRVPQLVGVFSAESALSRLLSQTGLTSEIRGDSVIIRRAQAVAIAEPDVTSEEIVVVGTPLRDSAAAAIARKRDADTIRDVIAADTIGNFPDKSTAEALSRIPGVSAERDQGQARHLNIRGAPRNFGQVSFDGITIPGFDYETGLGGGNDRTARFDILPTEYASAIEVVKAVTPDLPADAISGRVNVITRGALDRPGFNGSLRVGAGYNEQGDGEVEDFGFTLSNTFFDDRLGVLITGSRFSEDKFTDNYESRHSFIDGRWWRNSQRFRVYWLNRTTESLSARIDFRLSPEHRIYLRNIYTQFEDDEANDNLQFNAAAGGVLGYAGRNGFTANTPTQGELVNLSLSWNTVERIYVQKLSSTTFGGESGLGAWDLDYNVTFNDILDEQDRRSIFGFNYAAANLANQPSVRYDYRDARNPQYEVFETLRSGSTLVRGPGPFSGWNQADEVPQTSVSPFVDREPTTQISAQFDAERDGFDVFGAPLEVAFGVKLDRLERSRKRLTRRYNSASLAAAGQSPIRAAEVITGAPSQSGFTPIPFRRYDPDAWVRRFNAIDAAGGVERPDERAVRYTLAEDTRAWYAMGSWRPDWGSLIFGLRSETTSLEAEAFTNIGRGRLLQRNVERDYTKYFPSVHVNWNVTEDWVARASFSTALARPSISTAIPNNTFSDPFLFEVSADGTPIVRLRPQDVFDPASGGVSGGNPFLEPTYSRGLDLSLERYFGDFGLFSIAAYYKWIDDPIYSSRQIVSDGRFDINLPIIQQLNAAGAVVSETRLTTRQGYTFSSQFNGTDGRLFGVELNYVDQFEFLPGPLAGFGVEANLTFAESEARVPASPFRTAFPNRVVPLQGASDRTANVTLFYERFGFSGRLSYQYRSGYLDSLDLGRTDNDIYWDENGRFDLALRYEVTPNASIYVDARNLTDEQGYRYIGDYARTYEIETFGRQFIGGVRLNF